MAPSALCVASDAQPVCWASLTMRQTSCSMPTSVSCHSGCGGASPIQRYFLGHGLSLTGAPFLALLRQNWYSQRTAKTRAAVRTPPGVAQKAEGFLCVVMVYLAFPPGSASAG